MGAGKAGSLQAQEVIYGSPNGGNVTIFWSHGVASFGVYTHRWRFVSTLQQPVRLCFSYTVETQQGREVHQVEHNIRPGETRDQGFWTMSRSSANPPISGIRDCSVPGSVSRPPAGAAAPPATRPPVVAIAPPRATTLLQGLQQIFAEQAARQERLRQARASREALYRDAVDRWRELLPYYDEIAADPAIEIEAFELQHGGRFNVRSRPTGQIDRLEQGGGIAEIAMTTNEERYQKATESIDAYFRWKTTMDTDPSARDFRVMLRVAKAATTKDPVLSERLFREACQLGDTNSCNQSAGGVPTSPPPPVPPPAPVAPPPAAPARPAGPPIPGTSWVVTGIRLHEGPPSGVPWTEQKYDRRWSRAVLRNLFVGLTGAGPAGTPLNAPARCSIDGADLHLFTDGAIRTEASWTSVAISFKGVGWPEPGRWPIGTFEVRCQSGGTELARTSFEVVQSIQGNEWLATDLKLYAAPDGGVPFGQRTYANRFSRAVLRRVTPELRFELQPGVPLRQPISCSITSVGFRGEVSLHPKAEPGWTSLFSNAPGFGWSEPFNWPLGRYEVACSSGGVFARTGFQVVQSLGAWLATDLRFYVSPEQDIPFGQRSYATSFAQAALGRLHLELHFEVPAGTSLSDVQCALRGPDALERRVTLSPRPAPDWTSYITWSPLSEGSLAPGEYDVSCANEGAVFARRSFSVVP